MGSIGRRLRPVVAVLLLALTAACGTEILSAQQGGALVHQTQLGMSREEVVSRLGAPHRSETYETTEFLFYNTNWALATAAEQRSPIAIAHDKVIGLGKAYYDTYVKAHSPWAGTVSPAPAE
jgi:SmpA/OmlA family protein